MMCSAKNFREKLKAMKTRWPFMCKPEERPTVYNAQALLTELLSADNKFKVSDKQRLAEVSKDYEDLKESLSQRKGQRQSRVQMYRHISQEYEKRLKAHRELCAENNVQDILTPQERAFRANRRYLGSYFNCGGNLTVLELELEIDLYKQALVSIEKKLTPIEKDAFNKRLL